MNGEIVSKQSWLWDCTVVPSFTSWLDWVHSDNWVHSNHWVHSNQVLLVVGAEFHQSDPLWRFPLCPLTARLTGPAAVQETGVPTTPAPSPEPQVLWSLEQAVSPLEHLHLYSLFFVNWYFWIKSRNLWRNIRWFRFKFFLQSVNNPQYTCMILKDIQYIYSCNIIQNFNNTTFI